MGKTNWTRVLIGGLLAGVVANVLGFAAWALFLGRSWGAAMETLGHPMKESIGSIVFAVVMYFVLGILAVWLYSAIRPRCGMGPRTAAFAGLAFWVLSGLVPTIWWGSLGLFPVGLLATDVVTYLVVVIVATLLGAWLYKEEAA